jgi:RNA polymerase sigma-70 factor (ECF subfamily)
VSLEERLENHGELPPASDLEEPDRMFGRRELASRIWDALATLPFEQRTAIILREIDGLSYEEIAFSLGVAVGTVKSRLTRAREALRARLREAGRS